MSRHSRFLEEEVELRDEEIAMAGMIIDNLSGSFDPTEWIDESRELVEVAAKKKAEGEEIVTTADAVPAAGVVDLMEALKASVEATKAKKAV